MFSTIFEECNSPLFKGVALSRSEPTACLYTAGTHSCSNSIPRAHVTRPPLAAGRLQLVDADHLTFRLKMPWSDGTTHLLLSPLELIEKLAALIPPPRLNLVRYHGILTPNARDRI